MILLSYQLSAVGISDSTLLTGGLVISTCGCTCMYFGWHVHASIWEFVAPIVLASGSFPFLGAPTRSLFTRVVAAAPGLIAAYVLRTPDQVSASPDGREFNPLALHAPILSLFTLIGVIYLRVHPPVFHSLLWKKCSL
jgi:ceroid-lipofuscinosis MFS transporter 7